MLRAAPAPSTPCCGRTNTLLRLTSATLTAAWRGTRLQPSTTAARWLASATNRAARRIHSTRSIGFFWDRTHAIQPIPPIADDKQSWAWGINEHGQVVGQSFNRMTGAAGAFLYEKGLLTDLNTLIQPSSSLQLLVANDINDAGEIVGFALDTNTNATVAFLAVPVYSGNQPSAYTGETNFYSKSSTESGRRPFAGTFSRFAANVPIQNDLWKI